MKKWYRKTVTRTIVLVVAILSGALLVTNLLSLLTLAGGMSFSQIQKMNTQSFEESEEFSKMVESYMYDVQVSFICRIFLKVTAPTIRKSWWM